MHMMPNEKLSEVPMFDIFNLQSLRPKYIEIVKSLKNISMCFKTDQKMFRDFCCFQPLLHKIRNPLNVIIIR